MIEFPPTIKRSIELLGLVLLGFVFYYGSDIITPLLMAFFLSILLLPLYRILKHRLRMPEVIAISLSLVTLVLFLTGVVWFFTAQVAALVSDLPTIQKNLSEHWSTLTHWIEAHTSLSVKEQLAWLNSQSDMMIKSAGTMVSGAALSLSSVFIFVGLLPIYIFLFLNYKNLLMRFVYLLFQQKDHDLVTEVLIETESIIKSYLIGLLIQITYITILLGGALAILGIKHALLIGIIFAILNLIPYVGALIGNILGVLLTLTSSSDLSSVFTVLIAIAAVQFLDNNILMPRIVGSKVKLNALASILGVVIGGTLAGISGMFLSLPMMAVLKIVFDKTPMFRQWGLLLGDENPKMSPIAYPALRLKNRRVREQEEIDEEEKTQNPPSET